MFDDLGDFQVKGKTEPSARLRREERDRRPDRLEVSRERGLTPLIGRAAERERLAEAFRRASGGPRGRRRDLRRPGRRQVAPALRVPAGPRRAAGTSSSRRRAPPTVAPWRTVRSSSCIGDTSIFPRSCRPRRSGGAWPRGSCALDLDGEEPAFLLHHFLGSLGAAGVPAARAGGAAPGPHERGPRDRHLPRERAAAGGRWSSRTCTGSTPAPRSS